MRSHRREVVLRTVRRSASHITALLCLLLAGCTEPSPTVVSKSYKGRSAAPSDAGVDAGAAPGVLDAGLPPKPRKDGGGGSAARADAGADGGDFASCSDVELRATTRNVPVDIVWIIDSSPSMRNEIEAIQQNLNAFASKFADAAIDVRVVVMTDGDELEVPAPLGTDATRFLFVDRGVGSDDALGFFVEHFADYATFLRPDAKLELIAVSDDESDLAAEEFVSDMRARAGKDFRLHAIASENIDGQECDGAAAPGDAYYAAAALTSGLTFSVCQADGSALFDVLTKELTTGTPLPCELNVPEPPPGMTLDPNLINVVHEPATGQGGVVIPRVVIPRVSDRNRCAQTGWFYDNPTTPRVLSLCPRTCDSLGTTGRLRVTFGCSTAILL